MSQNASPTDATSGRGRGTPWRHRGAGLGYTYGRDQPGQPQSRGGQARFRIDDKAPLQPEDYPKGPLLAKWTPSDFSPSVISSPKKVTKENYTLLASYSWLPRGNGRSSALLVPGLPPRWKPAPALPAWLPPDTGVYYIDQNGYRSPSCPLAPLFLSLFTLNPNFDPNPIDLVTDRNNLRKLFRFISGDPSLQHDFKFYVEVINKTVLITRWEKKVIGEVARGEFRGFGHGFEKEFLKLGNDVKGSTGHHRVCRYNFAGLDLLVRFSADGYLSSKAGGQGAESGTAATGSPGRARGTKGTESTKPYDPRSMGTGATSKAAPPTTTATGATPTGAKSKATSPTKSPHPPPTRAPLTADSLAALLSSLSTSDTPTPASPPLRSSPRTANPPPPTYPRVPLPSPSPIEIIPTGHLLPQDRILEVKTRSFTRTIDMADQTPQLYFSHTKNLYVGYHQRGTFTEIDMESMNDKVLEKWENDRQAELRKLGVLLRSLVDKVREVVGEGGRGCLVCVEGELRLYDEGKWQGAEGEMAGRMPEGLRRWWGGSMERKASGRKEA